jgi:ribosome-binding factor A
MAKEFSRSTRVAELVQRELAVLIPKYLQDADVGLVTVSNVNVSPDLKNARIFVTSIGNTIDNDQIAARLNEHVGQFRHDLSQSLILRSVPRLHFEFDHALERANRLTALIDSLRHDKSAD